MVRAWECRGGGVDVCSFAFSANQLNEGEGDTGFLGLTAGKSRQAQSVSFRLSLTGVTVPVGGWENSQARLLWWDQRRLKVPQQHKEISILPLPGQN